MAMEALLNIVPIPKENLHRIPAEILDQGKWPTEARTALLRDRLATPVEYLQWLAPATVDVWRTTYYHHLTGPDPVWNWVTGSVLRPVLAALDADDAERFAAACIERYRDAYPPTGTGATVLPFSRLFLVAVVPD
jgi:trans-aconitate 2-methyltransferase